MTDTTTEPTAAEERDLAYAAMRRKLQWQSVVLAAFWHNVDLDPPDLLYPTPHWTFHPDASHDEQRQRAEALSFLARHARGILKAAELLGISGLRLKKLDPEIHGAFGVAATLEQPGHEPVAWFDTPSVYVDVRVPSEVTCDLVPTGEDEVIPAQPERRVPKMRRQCPPSIFAGLVETLPAIEPDPPAAAAEDDMPLEPF